MMQATLSVPAPSPGSRAGTGPAAAAEPHPALVCLDDLAGGGALIAHARAVAASLGAPLAIGHVIESRPSDLPADPVRWTLRRERARGTLADLATGGQRPVLLEGRPGEQLLRWIGQNRPAFVALYTRSAAPREAGARLGHVAATILAESGTSVLLVPPQAQPAARYRRILLPLDGSFGSERAIPAAARLAAIGGGELLLVHVVPAPEITMIGPIEQEAVALRAQLLARNERVALGYLESIRRRLVCARQPASLYLTQGDARDGLSMACETLAADLIVMATLGNGGHGKQGRGHVAAHLAGATRVPVLLIQPDMAARTRPERAAQS